MKKYRNPLRSSILLGCGAFVVLLCVTLAALGFVIYYQGMVEKYQSYIGDALRLTMTEIDGEDLKSCIESGEKSGAFQQTQDFLDRIKEHYDFSFVYIVKPLNLNETDNMMNVMAGMTEAERKELNGADSVRLGELTGNSYSPNVVQYYLNRMEGGTEISYYRNRTEFGYMYTGLLPITDNAGNTAAILAADLSMDEISSTLFRYVIILLAEIVILAALFLSLLYRWLNRRVIEPMTKLERSANSFVESSRGQENPDALAFHDPEIHTGDELESLSDALSAMSQDMKRFMTNLLKVNAEKERIGAELNVATKIQADMLPRIFPAFPERKEFDLYATMTPAKEVGGDFYDFFMVDDDHLAMVMADVSGKGVPAALFMVIAKTLIKNRAQAAGADIHPGEILADVNNQLCEGNEAELFVTVWLGILTISTGHLVSASAGHEYPAFYQAEEKKFALRKERHGPPLATMEGLRFRETETDLGHGDALFIYTDGVTEATSAEEKLFGEERMVNALNAHAEDAPETIISDVRKGIDAFVKDAPQFDDITMLCLRFR